jgi:hypothetical protein
VVYGVIVIEGGLRKVGEGLRHEVLLCRESRTSNFFSA